MARWECDIYRVDKGCIVNYKVQSGNIILTSHSNIQGFVHYLCNNWMLQHAFRLLGEVFFALFYCTRLGLSACLRSRHRREWIRAVSSRRAEKCCKKITSPTHPNGCRIIFCQPKANSARSCKIHTSSKIMALIV